MIINSQRKFSFLLSLLVFSAFANLSYSSDFVGKVLISRGKVHTDKGRKLSRRAKIFVGDTIVTGKGAAAQIRFVDGGLVNISENSKYRVDSYSFKKNNPTKVKSNSTLLKGKLQALSGSLIKSDPSTYKLKSKLTTIGIAGTLYTTELTKERQITETAKGATIVRTSNGVMEIGPESEFNFAVVSAKTLKPVGLIDMPSMVDHVLNQQTEGIAEDLFFENFSVDSFDFSDVSNFGDSFGFEDISNTIILNELPPRKN